MDLILISAFLVKHFIVDFPLQNKYQYLNKGTFMHPGGILHAYLHLLGTLLVLWLFGVEGYKLLLLSMYDGVVHYLVDYTKVNYCKDYDLTPTNSEYWYWILGFDQLLHQLTYIIIIALL